MEEWIIKQFVDQFRDFGLELPWYWDTFIDELEWYHHALHLGVWTWRPTLWWNPDAGVSPAEREWLQSKYPDWEKQFGPYWDLCISMIAVDTFAFILSNIAELLAKVWKQFWVVPLSFHR